LAISQTPYSILATLHIPPYRLLPTLPSAALATPQPHRLSVLLQLRDQLIALLHHIGILLVLVIRPVGLDDALDAVDGARDPVRCDELGEVPEPC
jgi:hypothetical protein